MKGTDRPRSILHVDLDPFFVSVERSLDPGLRDHPVIVGGTPDGQGRVAAVSSEARAAGVTVGQPLAAARRLCPQGIFRSGDLEAYARTSQEITNLLLAVSRRVERPSADEAYVDLTRDTPGALQPVVAAEVIKDELQRRLGLDASLGVASSRLAARVASSWARPRGLLVVLPGYETSFLAGKPVSFLPDLPPHLRAVLESKGMDTLGQLAAADPTQLATLVGPTAAERLQEAARGQGEAPIPAAAAPSWLQEEAVIRDRRNDRATLASIVESLAGRAFRRLRPFGLTPGALTVEVERQATTLRRDEAFDPGLGTEEAAAAVARTLAQPLIEPALGVRTLRVRLSRLQRPGAQASLFPRVQGSGGGR
ncbi:MAG TPA: hypothetical protein VJU18_07915 [Vicinamibacteria bacterium]|nr:hypothetical protein [Vicinamibacteria bacterium]